MKRTIFTTGTAKTTLQTIAMLICGTLIFACGSSGDGDSGSEGQNLTLADLVGTYVLTGFTISNGDKTVEDEDAQSWAGEVQITDASMLTVSLSINGNPNSSFTLKIYKIENDALEVGDDNCREYIDMNREGDNITLIFSAGKCFGENSLVLEMRKDLNAALALSKNELQSGSGSQYNQIEEMVETLVNAFNTP